MHSPTWQKAVFGLAVIAMMAVAGGVFAAENGDDAPGREMAVQATKAKPVVVTVTADHSKFKELQFTDEQLRTMKPQDVTKACLSCHNKAGEQLHNTIHWTWKDQENPELGKGGLVVNNYCVAIPSNEPRCTSCHAGYGWKDKHFDFTNQNNIDCLVCHEQTGSYKKFPAGAGMPAPWIADPNNPTEQKGKLFGGNGKTYYAPDWNKVSQSVSRPGRKNCGTCHFYGGGGDGVKHGDLDSSMGAPAKNLDVHMGSLESGGQNFTCARCHTTRAHHIAGRVYTKPAAKDRKSLLQDDLGDKIMCESCHGTQPHKTGMSAKLNDHTDKVACQSCHIPEFARELPTKMWWDWSKAGELRDGKPVVDGPYNRHSYDKKKGEFRWEKNVVPEYHWYNGAMSHVTVEDKIDPTTEVKLSWPQGDRSDPNARIMPFKVHRGKTMYDKVNKTMLIPHLFPRGKDDKAAYWKGYNWNNALQAGMEYVELPYSGEYGFVQTAFVYPTTHMVAPKDNALQCHECHRKVGSRLSNLTGFYMPARDGSTTVDAIGWFGVGASLLAVILHAIVRFISGQRRKED